MRKLDQTFMRYGVILNAIGLLVLSYLGLVAIIY